MRTTRTISRPWLIPWHLAGVCAHSTQAHRQSEAKELQVVAMAAGARKRYSIESHSDGNRWDEGNLYRARKRMRA